jgi:hypothetical protein
VDDILTESNGPIHTLPAAARADARQVLIDFLANASVGDFGAKMATKASWAAVPNPAKQAAIADPILGVITKGLNDPWYNSPDAPPIVGNHVYQRSYPPAFWVRYEKAARNKLVSKYQFRAPGEWFAEVYAAYYRLDGGKSKGERLGTKDSDTKTWFDTNIDSGYQGGKRTSWV